MKKNTHNNRKTNRYLIYFSILFSVLAVIIAVAIYLQIPKIGYIDSAILMQQYRGAIQASELFNKEKEEWENNIITLETELNELNREFIEKGANWKENTIQEKKKRLEDKQKEYYKYRTAIEEKAAKRENELLQPVFDQLNADIADFAKKHNYDIIWGTLTGGNILYGTKAKDLTERFLDYANNLIENE